VPQLWAGLAIGAKATGALEFSQARFEQQARDCAEGCFGGKKTHAGQKSIGTPNRVSVRAMRFSMFRPGDCSLARALPGGSARLLDEDAESVTGNLQ